MANVEVDHIIIIESDSVSLASLNVGIAMAPLYKGYPK